MVQLHKFKASQPWVFALNSQQMLARNFFNLIFTQFTFQLHTQSDGTTVHTVQMDGHSENMQVELSEALSTQDGQLLITNEDGNGKMK